MGFDRVAVSPPLSGRSSAPDWGRPAEQEGAWNGDSVADVPQARHGPQGGGGLSPACGAHGGAVTLMILPQVHLRKPCYDFYFL